MTLEGSQTVPVARPGHRLFVTGMVLGLAVGMAAGHLLLFSRSRTPVDAAASAEEEFARLVASTPRFAAVGGPATSEDAAFSILEFDGREDGGDVGRVKLSLSARDEESLHYFPEALHAPGARGMAPAENSAPAPSAPPGTLQMTADASQPVEAPPKALQPPPGAEPIDKATSDREALARTIIKEELPDATDQEWEVWYEVLQGLPGEDIKGILRMRKHIDAQAGVDLHAPWATPPAAASRTATPAEKTSQQPPTCENADAVGRRILVAERNLANRQTVAYKQQIPVLVETAGGAGVSISRVIRDMRQGELECTDRTLDVALSGPGFLQVRNGDDVRYTRDGRLTLDAQGRLILLAPEQNWRIEPPITIPGEAIDIVISPDGNVEIVLPDQAKSTVGMLRIVRFLNPTALAGGHEGLYEATPEAGRPHETHSPALPATEVVQRHLERSNVMETLTQADASADLPAVRH